MLRLLKALEPVLWDHSAATQFWLPRTNPSLRWAYVMRSPPGSGDCDGARSTHRFGSAHSHLIGAHSRPGTRWGRYRRVCTAL